MITDIHELKFYATSPHDCSYIEGEIATTLFLDPKEELSDERYSELLDLGFRRSGSHIYRPYCDHCSACISVRVPSVDFSPSRQQRRIIKRNQEISVMPVPSIDNSECYQLFEQYINGRHADGDMFPTCLEDYQNFLCVKNNFSCYFEFRLNSELVGIAISDKLPQGLSAVYSFFNPSYDKRSLGTYMILWQILETKRLGLHALYLGYWIKQCQKMRYKSKFRPLELYLKQQWHRLN